MRQNSVLLPRGSGQKRGACYAALLLRFGARSSPCKHPRCRLIPYRLDLSVSYHPGCINVSDKLTRMNPLMRKRSGLAFGPLFSCVRL